MSRHFFYIVRNTTKRRNVLGLTTSLQKINERYLKKPAAAKKIRRKSDAWELIYYESFPTLKEARDRKVFFGTRPGLRQLRDFLRRWDVTEVID